MTHPVGYDTILFAYRPVGRIICYNIVFYMLYLEITNTFLKNDTGPIYSSYSKLSNELKNNIKIKVGQAVLELLITTIF